MQTTVTARVGSSTALLCDTRPVQQPERLVPVVSNPAAPSNLAQLITSWARLKPDKVALVQPGAERRNLTWGELDSIIDGVSSGLAAQGLVAGQRVCLCGPNSIELVVAYFAVLRAGFVAVPVNPDLSEAELRTVVAATGVRVLLGPTTPVIEGVSVLALDAASVAALGSAGTSPVISPRDAEALAVLVQTAGTSGDPKVVMLPHRALVAHLENVAPLGVIEPATVVLAVLPMFGIFGLNAVVGGWAMGGATLVILDGFPDDILTVIVDEGVDNLPLAPAMLYRLLHHENLGTGLPGVRTVVSGAAPLPTALADAFVRRTGLRVDQGYGLTEAGPGVAATLGGELLGPGHVGRVLPGVSVRIGVGEDDSEPAEISVRGDNLFTGYWPDGRGGPDPDGWFATGDIGYLRDGELFLVDRARDLMMVNGFHVYPAEVEDVIAELPEVLSVAVIGRSAGARGDQVVAFVVGPGIEPSTVRQHCAARLAKFKQPAEVHVVTDLPRGATGKIKKGSLRALLDEFGAGQGQP